MPCSENHFIRNLDELRLREEQNTNHDLRSSAEHLRSSALNQGRRRGGPRPGSGPPKGNLNALKHGRFSRRHKIILEAILEVPQAREALIGIMKRNRTRQKQAELEAAYLLMRWLATHNPQFLPAALNQACPECGVGSRGGHERAAADPEANTHVESPSPAHGRGARGEGNDQTQNDQLQAALSDMREAFNKKLVRKTTKRRTPKVADQPNAGAVGSLTRRKRSANLNVVPPNRRSGNG